MGTHLGKVHGLGGSISMEQSGNAVEFVATYSVIPMTRVALRIHDSAVREMIERLCLSPGLWEGPEGRIDRRNLIDTLLRMAGEDD